MKNKNYLTPNEAADLLMVSPVTVRQWAQKGILKALTTAGGHRRFIKREVELFAKQRGLTLQPPMHEELHILIVDDDRQLSRYLVELFTTLPEAIVTKTASNGFEAGRLVQTFQPDVVLLDLMMPGLDGFAVCHLLKHDPQTRAIQIIAMTGYYTPENVEQIVEAGAETCLRKPLEKEVLLGAIGLAAADEGKTPREAQAVEQ